MDSDFLRCALASEATLSAGGNIWPNCVSLQLFIFSFAGKDVLLSRSLYTVLWTSSGSYCVIEELESFLFISDFCFSPAKRFCFLSAPFSFASLYY